MIVKKSYAAVAAVGLKSKRLRTGTQSHGKRHYLSKAAMTKKPKQVKKKKKLYYYTQRRAHGFYFIFLYSSTVHDSSSTPVSAYLHPYLHHRRAHLVGIHTDYPKSRHGFIHVLFLSLSPYFFLSFPVSWFFLKFIYNTLLLRLLRSGFFCILSYLYLYLYLYVYIIKRTNTHVKYVYRYKTCRYLLRCRHLVPIILYYILYGRNQWGCSSILIRRYPLTTAAVFLSQTNYCLSFANRFRTQMKCKYSVSGLFELLHP